MLFLTRLAWDTFNTDDGFPFSALNRMYNGLSFIPTKLNRSIEYCDALAFNSLFVIPLLDINKCFAYIITILSMYK